jgi:hypothetical protein
LKNNTHTRTHSLQGTAITYITPEEEQYAPDLVKALTQSGKPVPEELKKLADGIFSLMIHDHILIPYRLSLFRFVRLILLCPLSKFGFLW